MFKLENENKNNNDNDNDNDNDYYNGKEKIKENQNQVNLLQQSKEFFEYIQNNNIEEIKKFFRNERIKPWEFLLDDDFSGKKINILN
jgi:hypothetical protein